MGAKCHDRVSPLFCYWCGTFPPRVSVAGIIPYQRSLAVFPQQTVHFCDVTDPVPEHHEQHGVPGKPPVERGHAVKRQRLPDLLRTEPRSQAQPQDHVPLPGVLFSGDQLVAVALRDVRRQEHVLQQQGLLPAFSPHVGGKRPGIQRQRISSLPEKVLQFCRRQFQQLPLQFPAGLFIGFLVQLPHPFCQIGAGAGPGRSRSAEGAAVFARG